ncbi:HD-GYP domain-containing protein [Exilibacterium tricleocarpae]|uniref:HD-GYP domain-containing protein n=1 Tax=Exilibacterium tricleocarpae TaxID=2591008 RepID=A0A545TFU4_9GAMM|nr:HD-GYP domain-containing protein [Exilibacterium tricleocarpae]TQV76075.1 HD-GYP domain-containing protein [Exilibacterium tricleocarpae]
MAKIKRIPTGCLKVGMYIADTNHDWVPADNLRRHGLVRRPEVIKQIAALGVTEIHIDTEKGLDCAEGMAVDAAAVDAGAARFDREKKQARQLYGDSLQLIDQLLVDVKAGGNIPVQKVEDMADGIIGSLSNNQNALACITRLRDKDQYLLEHSFNVAVLMGVLARSLNIGSDDLHQIVTGALLHDVGKIHIPDRILHKPGRLEAAEWEEMKRHVDYGRQVLGASAGISAISKDICSQHHERLDGTGYPRGLSGEAISLHGRMAAVVDVYDAVTSDRVYHTGMAPTLAMKKLVEWSGSHLDRELVYQFIRCMSVYPAGALVELDSGNLAVVLEANTRQQDKPRVLTVYREKNQRYIAGGTLDLAHTGAGARIVRAVEARDYGIDLADFL